MMLKYLCYRDVFESHFFHHVTGSSTQNKKSGTLFSIFVKTAVHEIKEKNTFDLQ